MQYLVRMDIADSGRAKSPQEGLTFIEQLVLPTLERCKALAAEGKIVAGGPVAGTIGLALVIEAESIQALDDLLEDLPLWPRMKTVVTPLTTFDGRGAALRPRLERLRGLLQSAQAAR